MSDADKIEMMSNMVSLAYEMRFMLENDDTESFGELLHQNWMLKKNLAEGITDAQINSWYNKGIAAGATGGKLLGAGNGGFIMFFAPKENHSKIINSFSDLKRVPFSFEYEGSKILFQRG